MSIRDFTPAVWEAILDKLSTRHQARLIATGDTAVQRSVVHAQRGVDLLFLDEHVTHSKTAAASNLVRNMLVAYAKHLYIDNVDICKLSAPLASLTSLYIHSTYDNHERFLRALSDGIQSSLPTTFNLAALAPSLKSVRMGFEQPMHRLKLPQTLETADFWFDACDDPLSHIDDLDCLVNLSSLDVRSVDHQQVLHQTTRFPPHLTHLSFSLTKYDLPFLFVIPHTLRSLRVRNETALLDTSHFQSMPLMELVIEDSHDDVFGSTTRLSTLPATLTSLTLETVCVSATTTFTSVIEQMPTYLTRLSVTRFEPMHDDMQALAHIVNALAPRMGLEELERLALSMVDTFTPAAFSIVLLLTEEIKKFGPDGEALALVLAYKSSIRWAVTDDAVLEVIKQASADKRMSKRAFVSLIQSHLHRTHQFTISDATSAISQLLFKSVEAGDIECLAFTEAGLKRDIPDEVCNKLVVLHARVFNAGALNGLLWRRYARLKILVIDCTCRAPVRWSGFASLIVSRHVEYLPLLEEIVFLRYTAGDKTSNAAVPGILAKMRFYPTNFDGTFRFRVSPPHETPNGALDLGKK